MPSSSRGARSGAALALGMAIGMALFPATSTWAAGADIEVIGAGASFPAPAIDAWADAYSRETGVRLLYRSVGSAEGIRRVTARSADFAITDVPLTQAELVQDDLLQFPVLVGAIVPVVHLPGIADAELKLSGPVLADIFLGKITRWDAPAIKALNTGLSLPDLPITVVHRADGSGTSFVFTYYLAHVSAEWQDRLGIGSRLIWPVGKGANGNEGVSLAVQETPGTIAYVEYAYAAQNRLATVQLRNAAGATLPVSEEGVRAALSSANWSRPGYYEVLVDRGGAQAWPLVGVSFALIHKRQEARTDARAMLRFLAWIYSHGEPIARRLHYVSLEDAGLVARIESSWSEVHDDEGRIAWKTEP
jgi:phosphate transport system substrate-binding protein